MGDNDLFKTVVAERADPFGHSPIQAGSRCPDEASANFLNPFGHDRVITNHRDGQRTRRANDVTGHRPGELAPTIRVEGGRQPSFCSMECLDRHEHHSPIGCYVGAPVGLQVFVHCRSVELRRGPDFR